MKLIKPSYLILDQKPGLDGIYEQIELAGRTCYKSRRPEGQTAKDFVDRMIASQHYAMLEHGTVYLDITNATDLVSARRFYHNNPYSKVYKNTIETDWECPHLYVTTNYRVLVENNKLDDLKYMCEPTEWHEKRITVRFTTDQGILREYTRHRVFSFAVESTRYCNYMKEKFGKEITCIDPNWEMTDEQHSLFVAALNTAEQLYFSLIESGWKAQQARNVLSLATKCEIVMTGFVRDWKHFFFLRDAVSAHPQARELAKPLHDTFVQRGWVEE